MLLTKIKDLETKIKIVDKELDKCLGLLMKFDGEEMIKRIQAQSKELEIEKTALKQELSALKLTSIKKFTVEDCLDFLNAFLQKGNETELEYRQRIIKGLVHTVFLDDFLNQRRFAFIISSDPQLDPEKILFITA